MSEAEFQRQVEQLASHYGWWTFHVRPGRTLDGWCVGVTGNGIGFPDLQALKGARQIVAELKVGRNKPTPAQLVWLGKFEAAGVPAYVWTPGDWDEIEAVLSGGTT